MLRTSSTFNDSFYKDYSFDSEKNVGAREFQKNNQVR